jgi:hypothetical protein
MPARNNRPIEYWSTPMIKGRLIELLDEMGLHPFGKRPALTELVECTMHDLGALRPGDPRAAEAQRIAEYWWHHERSSK